MVLTITVFSGRLPYTIAKSINDYGAKVTSSQNGAITPITYSEGIFGDYKFFDQNNIEPRFPFGFGLSYTTFQYSGLTITGSVGTGSAETGPGSALDPWSVNLHTTHLLGLITPMYQVTYGCYNSFIHDSE